MLNATLLILLSSAWQPSARDRAALARLRPVVAQLERSGDFRRFERAAPKSQVRTWERIQRGMPDTADGYLDLALTLAYYGVDLRGNVARLEAPYRRQQRRMRQERPLTPEEQRRALKDETALEALPDDLALLYRRRRDPFVMGALLNMRMDGAAAEAKFGTVQELWRTDAVPLLRAASGAASRVEDLATILSGAVSEPGDPRPKLDPAADLRRLEHHPDPRVAGAARAVLRGLRRRESDARGWVAAAAFPETAVPTRAIVRGCWVARQIGVVSCWHGEEGGGKKAAAETSQNGRTFSAVRQSKNGRRWKRAPVEGIKRWIVRTATKASTRWRSSAPSAGCR